METKYLAIEEAFRFIHECEQRDVFIYGVERFICNGGVSMPDLDDVAGFSSLSSQEVEKSIASARSFLALYGRENQECFKIVIRKS
ncbi:hypothetical protein [Phyllobacterium phragmitis]|uniref:hypothetical protein n=1 Tax=Phyllobacterium phragmitis TaxID=2670329 RepID=UPI0011B234E6|nr:hypothetical protein [Phyllobacterium phragmitis]